MNKNVRYLVLLALLIGLYWLAARAGLFLQASYGGVTPLWPAAGIGVALLWRGGWKWAPVILVGEFITALWLDQPVIAGLSGAASQSLEAGIAATLLRRARVSPAFDSARDLGLFIVLGCLLPPLVGASWGALGLWGLEVILADQAGASWLTWWLGDAMGILVITPWLALWSRQPWRSRRWRSRWGAWAGAFGLAGLSLIAFAEGEADLLFFLLLPFMVLTAVYTGAAGAAGLAVLFAGLVLGMEQNSAHGHFIAAVRIAFVGTSTVTGLLIAAVMAERRQVDRLLSTQQRQALATMRAIGDGVVGVNAQGQVSFLNPAAERLTGWTLDEAAGLPVEAVLRIGEGASDAPGHPVRRCLERGRAPARAEHGELRDRAGAPVAAECTVAPVQDASGAVVGAVAAVRDVTVEHHLRARLIHQANHDPVTGLPNRYAFDGRLRELAARPSVGGVHALLYLDLDQFKLVNDTCGHEAGDRLLARLAVELSVLAAIDIYRLGGDEFGVLLADSGEEVALDLAETLRRGVQDFRFDHGELVFTVGVSIGIAYFSGQDDPPEEILSCADIACYMAKDAGRNRIHAYRAADAETMRRHTAIQRLSQLQAAMDDGRFQLYCQRIVRLDGSDGDRLGFELLLRLQEDGQVVGPGTFLPVAERFGLMPYIDRWVTEQAFRYLHQHGDHQLRLSVNLTGTTLDDPDFQGFVDGLRTRYPIDPRSLCFEVTESVAIERLTRAVQYMQRMSEQGYRFALDDFGSGVASFAYLQELPVAQVKIDGGLVRGLATDPDKQIIVEALVRLAQRRGITCVAEWIEDADTLDRLRALGVEKGQGYYLHRPQPLAELETLLPPTRSQAMR